EDGIRDRNVTGVQTCALPIYSGNASQEMFSLDRVVVEPLGWPGNLRKTIDDTNLGKYLFEVRDRKTSQMLYSRGFASIYGEWERSEERRVGKECRAERWVCSW